MASESQAVPATKPATSSQAPNGPWTLTSPNHRHPADPSTPTVTATLTHATLSSDAALAQVHTPRAGARVLFSGTTRDTFQGKAVKQLKYEAYVPMALRTMVKVGEEIMEKWSQAENGSARTGKGTETEAEEEAIGTTQQQQGSAGAGALAISITHRLGVVPVGEESVLIAVSSAHRAEAFRAAEEALEAVKDRVEIWKLEEFYDGDGVWRANRDGKAGVRVDEGGTAGNTDRGDDGDVDGDGGRERKRHKGYDA